MPRNMNELCPRCGRKPIARHGRCDPCGQYLKKHGVERPLLFIEREIRRELERERASMLCKVCSCPRGAGARDNRCRRCANYWYIHKRERPKRYWAKDVCCKNCGIPRANHVNWSKDHCHNCVSYRQRTGKNRPKHLWGDGQYGWCECGYPADNLFEKIPLCNRCFAEAKIGAFTVLR